MQKLSKNKTYFKRRPEPQYMSQSHWLTDVVGAVCIGWPVMHLVYFWLLLIPKQARYYITHAGYPHLPVFWELRIGGFLTLTTVGIILFINGWRALILGRSSWLMLFAPLSLFLICRSISEVMRIRQKVVAALSL